MQDWLQMINSINGFSAKELVIFDFQQWLKPYIQKSKKLFMINQPHVFRFTRNGIITKKFVNDSDFSLWRGRSDLNGSEFELYHIITEIPQGSPKIMAPKAISSIYFSFQQYFILFPLLFNFYV